MKNKYIIFVIILSLALCFQTAFADEASAMSEMSSKFRQAYDVICSVATVLAALGLAASALEILAGSMISDSELSKLKKRVFYIIIALAAIYLLPNAIAMGMSIGKAHQWTPNI